MQFYHTCITSKTQVCVCIYIDIYIMQMAQNVEFWLTYSKRKKINAEKHI